MQTTKNKIRESERARIRYIHRFLSLDSEVFSEIASLDTPVSEIDELDEISTMTKIEHALSPDEFQLLKRLVFDNESHMAVAKEFGITVWASQKRLERIRKKLFEAFPERKRKNNF